MPRPSGLLKIPAAAAAVAAFLLAQGVGGSPARAESLEQVDLALVIAVDVSYSMDQDEQRLQRGGYADALRSRLVLDAVRRGAIGKIAVVYIEWASANSQEVIVPWQVIEGPETADAFVAKLEAVPIRRGYRTSISGGIDFSVKLIEEAPVQATRRVIDVSGDGANNQGRPVTAARDEAVAKGIVINGLPIMLKRPGYMDVENLDVYYEECVIGGRGAFVVTARELINFAEAIRNKLLLEVAGREPEAIVRPAQVETRPPRVSCMAGETQWDGRIGK